MADASTILTYSLQPAPGTETALKQQMSKLEKGLKFNSPFTSHTRSVRDFASELERANQRVITLGLAFQTLRTSQQVLSGIVKSAIEVEQAFVEINSVFGLTSKNLDRFGKELFNVARDTSQSFQKVTEAAKEFSRQGLSAEETLKRTKSALTLSRVAALDVVDSVNVLTASINGFSKAGLTAADVTNKLLAVDTRFAVSAGDLAQALSRAGASASDAGVDFNELIGIITAVQQTTARGGAVIGNALKSIFTRIQRQDTVDALESLGITVKDLQGNMLSGMKLLENFGATYDKLGVSAKKSAAELVGGVYQINVLKAALGDLSKAESIYADAKRTSATATDEETRRNEALNKSLSSTIERLQLAGKQIGSNVGSLGFSGFARGTLDILINNPITKALEDASGNADSLGGKFAEGFIRGFGNAIIAGLGPILTVALSRISLQTARAVTMDLMEASGMTGGSMTPLRNSRALIRGIPRGASGYVPFAEEAAAISAGVGGARPGARPVLINNFKFSGGKSGPIVANSSEFIVPNFAAGGSAIFNPEMIRKFGLPPGATPVAAGGFIPNFADPMSKGPNVIGKVGFPSLYLPKGGELNPSAINEAFSSSFLPTAINSVIKPLANAFAANLAIAGQRVTKQILLPVVVGGHGTPFGPPEGMNEGYLRPYQTVNRNPYREMMVNQRRGSMRDLDPNSLSWMANESRQESISAQEKRLDALRIRLKEHMLSKATERSPESMPWLTRNTPTFQRVSPAFRRFLSSGSEGMRNAASIGSFALPFLSGFVPEGQGGTAQGMGRGALSGSMMGAGFGLSIGSMTGTPMGALAGGVLGAAIGGVTGLIGKMNESFEEMAKRLEDKTKSIKQEYDLASSVTAIRSEIKAAEEAGQFGKANTLRLQEIALIQKIADPEYQNILSSGGKLEDVRNALAQAGSQKMGTDYMQSRFTTGAKSGEMTFGGKFSRFLSAILPNGVSYTSAVNQPTIDESEISNMASGFLAVTNQLPSSVLKSLGERARQDPYAAAQMIGQMSGMKSEEISKSLENVDPEGLRRAILKATFLSQKSNMARVSKTPPGKINLEWGKAKILGVAGGMEHESALASMYASGGLQIAEARQNVALGMAGTETDRLELKARFEKENVIARSRAINAETFSGGIAGLVKQAGSQGVTSPETIKMLQGITGVGGLLDLKRALESGTGKEKYTGLYSQDFITKIDELVNAMDRLYKTEENNISVTAELNRILQEQWRELGTKGGAEKEDSKLFQMAQEEYSRAIQRGDSPIEIERKRRAVDMAANRMGRRSGAITETQEQRALYLSSLGMANSEAILRENAILSNVNNPLISGADVSGSLMGRATRAGRNGNAMGSLSGGFSSVFAGLKQDIMDLSTLGQGLANTLQNSLGNAWGDFVTGAKSAKDAFRDFAVSIMGDASRALGSKAIQGMLGMFLGGVGFSGGGAIGMANGGKVPALLMGGEYVIGPNAAKSVGYDTLRHLNRYADGGMVRGGSGVKDDVPAKLPPGSFVVKKSAVNRLGVDYLDALASGGVQKRFLGGFIGMPMLYGALLGGGLGYAAGGKKGALIGAGIGAIGGGLYGMSSASSAAQTSSTNLIMGESGLASSDATIDMARTTFSPPSVAANAAAKISPLKMAAYGLGASAALGLASRAFAPKPSPGAISMAQIPGYARQLESEQSNMFSQNRFAYLQVNPQGGYSLGSFGTEPATRRWAEGGEVGSVDTPLSIGPRGGGSGGSAPAVSVKIEINNNGQTSSKSSSTGDEGGGFGPDFGSKIEKAVRPIVQDEIVRQMKNDGIFSQRSRYVNG